MYAARPLEYTKKGAAHRIKREIVLKDEKMRTKLIIDEDSVYEIDEECDRARKKSREQESKKKNRPPKGR